MIEVNADLSEGIKPPKFEELDHHFRVTLYHETHQMLTVISWQQDLIEYLKQYEAITIKDASHFWNKTERTASTRLKKMLGIGLIFEVSTGPYDPKKKFVLAK